jgi:hypothetical protein
MKHQKILGLMALTAVAVMAIGTANAAATTLSIGGITQNKSISLEASLKTSISALLKDEFGTTTDTCTTSIMKGKTTTFTGAAVSGPLSSLTFGNCTHTTTVLRHRKPIGDEHRRHHKRHSVVVRS